MPTAIEKAAPDIGWTHLQHFCDFAVSGSIVEKCFSLVEIKGRWTVFPVWLISSLFGWCSPPAIFSEVAKIVIDAIERFSIRAFIHISEKISEISPSFTNRNTSAAVVAKSIVTWVIASVDHVKPRVIGTASLSVSRMSVFSAIVEFGHGILSTGCCVKWRSDPARSGRRAFSVTQI